MSSAAAIPAQAEQGFAPGWSQASGEQVVFTEEAIPS